jgi:hypothetical protein
VTRPFEVDLEYLRGHLDDLVDVVFSDLQSQFLVLPRGRAFVDYPNFQNAYEVLKRRTNSFEDFNPGAIWAAFEENALCFVVVRTILGVSPPEWADLARAELNSVTQGYVRNLDGRSRRNHAVFARMTGARRNGTGLARVQALIAAAVNVISKGAPAGAADTVHRLDKVDTSHGLDSLRYVAAQHVPYAVLLYERYLGRPFATHRDAVSELVGDVMESAIEEHLARARISARKTKRAERVPGYEQAPDFFIPDEFNPAVVIEAKITGDDGTARDKVARIERLTRMRDQRRQDGKPDFEVVACIDGRGFGVRREDMRTLLLRTEGKLFTLATLDQLIANTRLRNYLPG